MHQVPHGHWMDTEQIHIGLGKLKCTLSWEYIFKPVRNAFSCLKERQKQKESGLDEPFSDKQKYRPLVPR